MPYDKWRRTEAKYKMPMKDIIAKLYKKHNGKASAVAKELGITPKGLRDWRTRAGCEVIVRIEC